MNLLFYYTFYGFLDYKRIIFLYPISKKTVRHIYCRLIVVYFINFIY
ncbi:hypothetical protein MCHI_002665 [Candidatus Magnetoovum chiemensis]|nr:hypothetical protein MCHI_002665 [Candidatus Magnetoovum chiemensis]